MWSARVGGRKGEFSAAQRSFFFIPENENDLSSGTFRRPSSSSSDGGLEKKSKNIVVDVVVVIAIWVGGQKRGAV